MKTNSSRSSRGWLRLVAALGWAVAAVIACEPAAAQPVYSIVDIGLIPGEITIPTGMSPGGVATGYTIGVSPPAAPSAFIGRRPAAV